MGHGLKVNVQSFSARKMSDLPPAARRYVKDIAELTGARLSILSIGPARGETIFF